MKNEQTIKDILDAVGGQDNVKILNTVLQDFEIILRDNSKGEQGKAEAVTLKAKVTFLIQDNTSLFSNWKGKWSLFWI